MSINLGVLKNKIDLATATLLELRFEGSEGSQVFTDSSSYNRSVTVNGGSPIISTTTPLSGNSSLLLGTNGTLTIPNFTTPAGNTNLRTIEFRIQIDLADIAFNESQGVFVKGVSSSFFWDYSHQCILTRNSSGTGGVLKMYYNISTMVPPVSFLIINIPNISANNHVAFTRRANGSFIAYLNGVQVDSLSATADYYASKAHALFIGVVAYDWATELDTVNFKGRLDNFKITNVDRYPTNFTPPV